MKLTPEFKKIKSEVENPYTSVASSTLDRALKYQAAGLSVFRLKGDTTSGRARKAPSVIAEDGWTWDPYKAAVPTRDKVTKLFASGRPYWIGMACGPVSGYRLVIDFDRMYAWEQFKTLLGVQAPGLLDRLCVVRTMKGRHVHLVCPDWPGAFPRSEKLARSPVKDAEGGSTVIETRGEGGYIVMPGGSAPYVHEAGPEVAQGTRVTTEELNSLLRLCRTLDEAPEVFAPPPQPGKSGDRPGDLFDRACAGNPALILSDFEAAGWTVTPGPNESFRLLRPGKTEGNSATFGFTRTPDTGIPLFHNFTSNAMPFEEFKAYTPFTCLAFLRPFRDNRPDWSTVTKEVIGRGYGKLMTKATAGRASDSPTKTAGHPKRKRGSDRRMGATPWLWWGVVQANALNALVGGIGANKSVVSAFTAAQVSTGRPFPFDTEEAREPGTVLYFGPESIGDNDAPDEEFLPRFKAAGGDLDRVFTYDQPFTLPDDLDWAEREITETGAKLMILDPANDFIRQDLRSGDDKQIRWALRPLAKVAARTGCTILLILHTNKKKGDKAEDRAAGAKAYVSVSRAAVYIAKDDAMPGRSLIAPIRTSRLKEQKALSFERVDRVVVDDQTGEEIDTFVCTNWRMDDRTADEIAGADLGEGAARRGPGAPRKFQDGHERVYALAAEGKTPQQIADDVGYDASRVRQLLRKKKEEESLKGNYSSSNYSSPDNAHTPPAGQEELSRRNNPHGVPGQYSRLLTAAGQFKVPVSDLILWAQHPEALDLDRDFYKPLRSAAQAVYGPLWLLFWTLPHGADPAAPDLAAWLDEQAADLAELDPANQVEAWDAHQALTMHELYGWPAPEFDLAS